MGACSRIAGCVVRASPRVRAASAGESAAVLPSPMTLGRVSATPATPPRVRRAVSRLAYHGPQRVRAVMNVGWPIAELAGRVVANAYLGVWRRSLRLRLLPDSVRGETLPAQITVSNSEQFVLLMRE